MTVQPINFSELYAQAQRGPNGQVFGGSVMFPARQALILLQTLLVFKEDILANDAGAYSIADNMDGGTAYWAGINQAKWITTSRPADCARTAITDFTVTSSSKSLCNRHVFLKFCKDSLTSQLNGLWTAFWGKGNDVNDILATPEGAAFFQKFVERVLADIGNDFAVTSWWGNHPIIASSLTTNPLALSDATKTRITNTLTTCDGWLKQVDALKTGSYPHINNDIDAGDFSGYTYNGDAIALIKGLDAKAHADFDEAMDGLRDDFMYPIVFVTKGIFNRLKEQLTDIYKDIPSAMNYAMNGQLSGELTPELVGKVRNDALLFDGKLVIRRSDWDNVAKSVGFYHHRALMTVPQNLGVAIDITNSGTSYDGMGLVITKSMEPDQGGAYFLETNYKQATNIFSDKYMVNVSATAAI